MSRSWRPRRCLGPHLGNNLVNLGIEEAARALSRYTEPEPELKLLLERLRLELPAQPAPKITPAQAETATLV